MRFIHKIGAGVVAAAMATAIAMPAMAFADDSAGKVATELDSAYLTKVIRADKEIGVYGSADAFTFDFVPATDATDSPDIAAVPATAFRPLTATINANAVSVEKGDYSDATQSGIVQLSLANIFNASEYSRAGVYNYIATERNNLTTSTGATVAETGAVQEYLVKVYVVNKDGGFKIEGIGVYKAPQYSTGTETSTVVFTTPGEGKADPTETEQQISDEVTRLINEGAGEYNGFVFENTYTQSGTLAVTKVVTNKNAGADYADRSLAWGFTTKLTLPTSYTDAQTSEVVNSLKAIEKVTEATANGREITVKFALNGGTSATDNDSITLPNVPVGTAYDVTEDAVGKMPSGWTQAQTSNVASKVSSNAEENKATITNQFNDSSVTPTGILISNLPYILLVGIPVIALLAWFTMRRRNMELED